VQSSNYPSQITLPFANNAGVGYINTIPTSSQIGVTAGAASYNDGFPPLTMIPKASGGTPPFGQDMNGVLNSITKAMRWNQAGAAYPYNSTFASDSNVSGYPIGAKVISSTGTNYWINTVENNTTNPNSGGAGWLPLDGTAWAAVTMTSSNVTLTTDQYGKGIIILSGLMTTNLNLIFPAITARWTVVNNCTGGYSVTLKTAAGTGTAIASSGTGSCQAIYGDGVNIKAVVGNSSLPVLAASATLPYHAVTLAQVKNTIPQVTRTAFTPTLGTTYTRSITLTAPCDGYVVCVSTVNTSGSGLVITNTAKIDGVSGTSDSTIYPTTEYAIKAVSSGGSVTAASEIITAASGTATSVGQICFAFFLPSP